MCVSAGPSCSAGHLSIGEQVEQGSSLQRGADDHPARRQVHPRAQRAGGHQNPQRAIPERQLQEIPLIHRQTWRHSHRSVTGHSHSHSRSRSSTVRPGATATVTGHSHSHSRSRSSTVRPGATSTVTVTGQSQVTAGPAHPPSDLASQSQVSHRS